MVVAFASAATGAEIGALAWNESNIKTLRKFDASAVLRFIDSLSVKTQSFDSTMARIQEDQIQQRDPDFGGSSLSDFGSFEFDWHPAGDNKYELAVASQSGPEIAFLRVYWRLASNKVRSQTFDIPPCETAPISEGENWYKGKSFTDIDGDGIDELILFVPIDQSRGLLNQKFVPNVTWPQVYCLRESDGPYVEASRAFSRFYESQFLPQLDRELNRARKLPSEARYLAALTMCRDKVLRYLGRAPTAGLAEAREWMTSPDPVLLDDARIVFEDIGGHQQEASAATLAVRNALQHWPDRSLREP
jgi:hypothetical protein